MTTSWIKGAVSSAKQAVGAASDRVTGLIPSYSGVCYFKCDDPTFRYDSGNEGDFAESKDRRDTVGVGTLVEVQSAKYGAIAEHISEKGATQAGRTAAKIFGVALEPAIWLLKGESIDAADAGLYGVGLVAGSNPLGWAAMAVGVVKSVVEDSVEHSIQKYASKEHPSVYRNIKPASKLSFFAQGGCIGAMQVASRGGVAWQLPNGVWVFLADAKNRLVCNYRPRGSRMVYRPKLPLQYSGSGYRWTSSK